MGLQKFGIIVRYTLVAILFALAVRYGNWELWVASVCFYISATGRLMMLRNANA
jgi:hypothetical protein